MKCQKPPPQKLLRNVPPLLSASFLLILCSLTHALPIPGIKAFLLFVILPYQH